MFKSIKFLFIIFLFSCASGPQKVKVGSDQCHFCKMTIMEENFACQTVTNKGKVYIYDDLKCQVNAKKEKEKQFEGATFYVANYLGNGDFLDHANAFFVLSSEFKSPMAGNIAAVATKSEAEKLVKDKNGEIIEIENAFK